MRRIYVYDPGHVWDKSSLAQTLPGTRIGDTVSSPLGGEFVLADAPLPPQISEYDSLIRYRLTRIARILQMEI